MGKILLRIGAITGIILGTLILFLIISTGIDYALGTERIAKITNATVPGLPGQPDVYAYIAKPEGEGPFPVVIMIHEFFGLNESIIGKAEGLAEEGYLVIAPDTFRGSTTSWIPRAILQVVTTDSEQINQDLDSVFAWLENQPVVDGQRIAIAGFCYGGRASLVYSLHNPGIAATVIFYGSPETDPAVLAALPGPVLGIFGGADNSIPLEDVEAFKNALDQAGIPNEITIYPNQPHAFVTDIEAIRQGGVQKQAWKQMLDFLAWSLTSENSSWQKEPPVLYTPPFDWGYYLRLALEHTRNSPSHIH
jgi:carboxymethylenebutenolidase